MSGVIRLIVIGVVGSLLLVGCGGDKEDLYSCEVSPSRSLHAVISGIPASGNAPLKLVLNGSGSTSSSGVSIESYAWYLNASVHLRDGPGPHTVALPPGNHSIQLEVTDANGNSDCVQGSVTVEPSGRPGYNVGYSLGVYDDRIITIDVTEIEDAFDLEAGDGSDQEQFIQHVSWVVYTHFQDDFDFLMLIFNRSYDGRYSFGHSSFGPLAQYHSVQNSTTGLSPDNFHYYPYDFTHQYGSEGRLQGVALYGGTYLFLYGVVLHEIMHRWANYMIPTDDKTDWYAHWGLSSVYGQLGGFDLRYLQRTPQYDNAHGEAYEITDGGFSPFHAYAGNSDAEHWERYVEVYSPMELYLMGLVPLDEVPAIQVATDAEPVTLSQGRQRDVYTVGGWETYDQARILREFGPRNPPYGQAQTDFRAAFVLLVNDEYPATELPLSKLSQEIHRFGMRSDGNSGADTTFWEATGGRATMETGRLGLSRKAVPSPPSPASPSPAAFERLRSGHGGTIPPIH